MPNPSSLLHNDISLYVLPWWQSSTESACYAGAAGSVPGSGRSLGEGNGSSLQYSCLGNTTDGDPGRLQSTGLKESDTT